MQSQQKRVKWSRGETAEALEERTDTGITSASVELMENCIPDIYGNISRRPVLAPLPTGRTFYIGSPTDGHLGFYYDSEMQVIPFYYTKSMFFLIGIHAESFNCIEIMLIVDGKLQGCKEIYATEYLKVPTTTGLNGSISFAQQDNYMVISDKNNVYKLSFENVNTSGYFEANLDLWFFSAGWYAPNGTNTKEGSNTEITGLNFQSNHVGTDIYTSPDGSTNVYTWIQTGISASGISATWSDSTTTFYFGITQDLLSYYVSTTPSARDLGSWTMTNSATYTDNTVLVSVTPFPEYPDSAYKVTLHITGTNAWFEVGPWGPPYSYNVGSSFSYILPPMEEYIPVGSIVHFPNNGGYMRVEGYDSDGTNLRMYGELLTPIADTNTSDTKVNIEYGYKSLQPSNWNGSPITPHPQKIVFSGQRLWAADWAYSITQSYAIIIGSQIARYTDFKNNYNQENEAITLDILTQYRERILHLIDYNGLKIMTDSYEYTYDGTNGVVKQSANGSYSYCEPIVFDSLCLYVDSSGCQVKAMQYEFQNNIFNSTTINQLAPKNLVWYPFCMAEYEDKVNNVGKYLFVKNNYDAVTPLAVCNFVPGNQANIWSRWSFSTDAHDGDTTVPLLHSVVNLKDGVIFLINGNNRVTYTPEGTADPINILTTYPAVLNFGSFTGNSSMNYVTPSSPIADLEIRNVGSHGTTYYTLAYGVGTTDDDKDFTTRFTLCNVDLCLFLDGKYNQAVSTDSEGKFTATIDPSAGTWTAGLPINATIRSHPIDVGGKTKSIKKRIGKARISVHDTEPGAVTINDKTGYMNPAKDYISFYGVTGMKDEIKYTITNKNGAMFHIESLLMNIEYGTLSS